MLNRATASLLIAVFLLSTVALWSAQAVSVGELSEQAAGTAEVAREVATVITEFTALAFCPVLGVSLVGGWTYWTTSEEQRHLLPFFFQPWFVGVCGLLSLLYIGKGTVLQFIPILKKPMDMLAVLTNGAGALVIFFPMLFNFGRRIRGGEVGLASLGFPSFTVYAAEGAVIETQTVPWIIVAIAVLFAAAAYWALWLLGNVVNSFILANPVPFLDVILMAAIGMIFAVLGLASWIHPFVGLAASLALVFIALRVAGWAFRWSVFALVFSWDFLSFSNERGWTASGTLRAFSDAALDLPKRTMGRLAIGSDSALRFVYRPWLIGPTRTQEITPGSLALGRSITHSCVIRRSISGGKYDVVVRFPPRYRDQDEVLSRALGLSLEDIGVLGGLRAAWRWCREALSDWRATAAKPAGASS